MKAYEFLFILKPTLTEEELKAGVESILDSIRNNGGKIARCDEMGVKRLAYPINKSARGYYSVAYFKANPSAIAEVERLSRFNENILRFLTVKYENKKEIIHWEKLALLNKEEKQNKDSEPKQEDTKE